MKLYIFPVGYNLNLPFCAISSYLRDNLSSKVRGFQDALSSTLTMESALLLYVSSQYLKFDSTDSVTSSIDFAYLKSLKTVFNLSVSPIPI